MVHMAMERIQEPLAMFFPFLALFSLLPLPSFFAVDLTHGLTHAKHMMNY